MEWRMGIDLAKPGSDKSVIIIPDDAEVLMGDNEVIVMIDGLKHVWPKGTIVFSQSGLKNSCNWSTTENGG